MSTRMTRVVMAADDGYARPLAAAGRSVIRHLGDDRALEFYVLDMGISAGNRAALEASFHGPNVEIIWLTSAQRAVAELPIYGWFTTAAYARLLIPEVLPQNVERALYMDCDLVVRRCVGELYDSDLTGCVARAVPDMGAAFVSCPWGVGGWFELGLSPSDFNFNTGVMLMDLAAWRREGIGRAAIDYAREYAQRGREHPLNVDQESLNATAGRRMLAVDPRWNQQGELFQTASAAVLPYKDEVIDKIRKDPWVIHYSTGAKPWKFGCPHPWLGEWFSNLDQTEFKGWRPAGPTKAEVLLRKAGSVAKLAGRRAFGFFERSHSSS
jgi:lipopolysaccharide biosynthesis glycosyltransferase